MARTDRDVQLLPDDAVPGGEEEFDESQLNVRFTTEEAESQARSYEALPSGRYKVYITDITRKTSTSDKNFGKPYWAMTLTVAEGPYEGRRLWTNVMLFDGALYSLAQLMKAFGLVPGADPIPRPESLLGQQVGVQAQKIVDQYKIDKGDWTADSGEPKPFKTEVRGFFPAEKVGAPTAVGGSKSGKDALLP
jgi:Protein of unknown function (DUF669)